MNACVLLSLLAAYKPLRRSSTLSFISRLQGHKPTLVLFPTYQPAQVRVVIEQRLASLPGTVLESGAVEFCARKVRHAGSRCSEQRDEHTLHLLRVFIAGTLDFIVSIQ